MPSSRIPSPSRSQGVISTPRKQLRMTRSVGSPARTNIRLSSVIESYKVSPVPHRHSVLNDDTDIDMPRRLSWWKKIDDNSRDVLELLERKEIVEINNVAEEFDVEVLSQENKNYALDLPESSDEGSINSIVIPQRKLFTQKENQPQEKFRQIKNNRETLQKLNKSYVDHDKDLNVGRKTLFNQPSKPRTKPVFPAALLDISANKTVNKTKEIPAAEVKGRVLSLFGGRPGTKRKNMFADFIVSESDDEISEIQPKVFGFQKRNEPKRRASSINRHSPTSSIDLEMDDWRLLPSSTMVENQINEATSPVKRIKLSNLPEMKNSEISTNSNNTLNKTKQTNKSIWDRVQEKQNMLLDHPDPDEDLTECNNEVALDETANNLNMNVVKNNLVKKSNEKISKENVIEQGISSNIICENEVVLLENKHNNIESNKVSNDSKTQNNSQDKINVELNNDSTIVQKLNKSIAKNKRKSSSSVEKYNEHNRSKDMLKETFAKEQSVNKDVEKNEKLGKASQNLNEENYEDQQMESEDEQNENDNYYEQHSDKEEEVNESTKEENNYGEIEEEINENEHLESESQTENVSEEEADNEETEVINKNNPDEKDKEIILHDQQINIEDKDQVSLPNVSLDTTGRLRKKTKSPEVILHDKTKQIDSFTVQARNTSVRKTKSIIFHNKLETVTDSRRSTGFSDATGNSSAEGSGWDSHRTTRKTLRQTFGKDFTPRKSLRALVMEKTAKLQANITEVVDNIKIPQANSTEYDQIQDELDSYQETEVEVEQNIEKLQVDENDEAIQTEKDQQVDLRDVTGRFKSINKTVHSEVRHEIEQKEGRSEVDQSKSEKKDETEITKARAETEHSKEGDETHQSEDRNEMDKSDNEERDETKPFEEREETEQTESYERNETENFDERDEVEESEERKEEEDSEGREEEEESEVTEEVEESEENEEVEKSDEREEIQQSEEGEEIEQSEEREEEDETEVRGELEESGEIDDEAETEVREESATSENEERDQTEQFVERDEMEQSEDEMEQSEDEMEQSEDETDQLEERNDTVPEDKVMAVVSDHEVSKRTRQTSLETYLQKIQEDNAERRRKMQQELRNSLKNPKRDAFNLFKVPQRPIQRSIKIQKPQMKKIKSVIPLEMLPSEVIEDMKYKPPKRFQPNNASWITKRLYKFLENKLEPKYDYKARIRAEKLVQCIYNFTKEVRRHDSVRSDGIEELKREMARLDIVKTHFDFYEFCHEFFPREIRIKVVPDIVNNIPLPRHGVFSDILR